MSQTANRYAKALFALAQGQNNLEAVYESLNNIAVLVRELDHFRQFLTNPLLLCEERNKILKALFHGRIPQMTYQFLLFITYKNRLNILKEIIQSFDRLYLSSKNQVRATVQTALPFTEKDKAVINQRLQDKLKCLVLSEWEVEPQILGGFRIYTEGKLYDYSFKSQLEHFKQNVSS